MIYIAQNSTVPTETWLPIIFSPTGDIDESRTNSNDLLLANTILRPTIALFEALSPQFDIWKLINWVWVSFYWMILSDFGQVAPTTYPSPANIFLEGSPVKFPNLTLPATFYPPTNNIFINNTLFEIYSLYIREFLQFPTSIPEFSELNDTNRAQPIETGFLRSYSCLKRDWKGVLSGTISVLAADYALFFGAYSLIILLAGWFQKRRQYGKPVICLRTDLQETVAKDVWRGVSWIKLFLIV